MSLRQLKFKPKLKPAAKTGENSNITSEKEVCAEGKPTDAVSNACFNNFPETEKFHEPCSEKTLSKNVHIPVNSINKYENIPTSRILLPDSSLLPKGSSNSEFYHSKEITHVNVKSPIIKPENNLHESTKKLNDDTSATTTIHIPLDLSPKKCSPIHQNQNLELSKTDVEYAYSNAQAIIDTGSVSQVFIHEKNINLNESTKNLRDETIIAGPSGTIPTQIGFNMCAKTVSHICQKPNLQLSTKVKNVSGNVHDKSQQNSDEDIVSIRSSNEDRNNVNEATKSLSDDTMLTNCTTVTHVGLDICAKKVSRVRQKPNFGLSKKAKDISEIVHNTSQPNEDIVSNVSVNENKTNFIDSSPVNTESSITKVEPNLSELPEQISNEAFSIETGRITPTHIVLDIDAKKISPIRQKPNFVLSKQIKDVSPNIHNTAEKLIEDVSKVSVNESIKNLCDDAITIETGRITPSELTVHNVCAKKVSRIRQKPNFGKSKKSKDVLENTFNNPHPKADEDIVSKVAVNENKPNFNDSSVVNKKSSITKPEPNLSELPEQVSGEAFPIETGRNTMTHFSENICNRAEKLIEDVSKVSVNESTKNLCDDTIITETCTITPTEPTVFNVCAKKVSRIRQKPNFGKSKKSKDVLENTFNNPHSKADKDKVLKVSLNENKNNFNDSSRVNAQSSISKIEPNLVIESSKKLGDEDIVIKTGTTPTNIALDHGTQNVSYIHQMPKVGLSKQGKDFSENICNRVEKLIEEDDSEVSANESTKNLCDDSIIIETCKITPKEPTGFDCAKKVSRIYHKPNFGLSKKSNDISENTFTNSQPKTDEDSVSKLSVNEENSNLNDSTKNFKTEKSKFTPTDTTGFDLCSKKVSRIRQKPKFGLSKKGKNVPGNTCNSSQQITDKEIVSKVSFESDDTTEIETGRTTSSSTAFDLCAKKVSRISKKPNLGPSKNYDRIISENTFNNAQQTINKDIVSQASININEEKNKSNESERKLGDNEITIETGRTPPIIGFDLSPKNISHSHYKPNVELLINEDDVTSRNAYEKNDEENPLNASNIKETSNFSEPERNLSDDDDTIESGRTTPTHIGFDLSPKKISRFQPRSIDDDTVVSTSTLTENYYGKKNSRKNNVSKIVNHSPNKLTSPQKGNFKPNLATLGKIKRPDKFTTSSYSKMESKAKQQLFKKFGKIEELDSSKLTMMDLIFYNPKSNPMSQSVDKQPVPSEPKNAEKAEEKKPKETAASEKNNSTSVDINKSDDILPVPQLKISADGKVIVAQESVVIKPSHNLENATFEDVIDGDFTKRKPMKNPNRCGWSHQDTIKFYKALNSLGCDFETMQSIFPDRSRRNLKSKFKKEEKLHGSLINKVLSRHSEFDLSNVVRELEIDTVYQNTIKNYGRELGTENEKRAKGRKKSISSIIAGKSPEKDDEESNDGPLIDGEFSIRKRKTDAIVISKLSNVLGLNDEKNPVVTEDENKSSKSLKSNQSKLSNDSTIPAVGNKLSKSNANDKLPISKPSKRKRRKAVKYIESDSDDDYESQYFPNTKRLIIDQSNDTENETSPKPTRILRKRKPSTNKNFVLSLEDLINLGIENEAEKTSENHIVINTNIEFENVKYTRYISYNSNNLENPIEINETVAHVD